LHFEGIGVDLLSFSNGIIGSIFEIELVYTYYLSDFIFEQNLYLNPIGAPPIDNFLLLVLQHDQIFQGLPQEQKVIQHLPASPLQLLKFDFCRLNVSQERNLVSIQAALKWKIHYSSAKIIARMARRSNLQSMFKKEERPKGCCGWKELTSEGNKYSSESC